MGRVLVQVSASNIFNGPKNNHSLQFSHQPVEFVSGFQTARIQQSLGSLPALSAYSTDMDVSVWSVATPFFQGQHMTSTPGDRETTYGSRGTQTLVGSQR